MDAFFASCEESKNPLLKGKPLIVGGLKTDLRSIVACPNYLARKRGIKTAMPLSQALNLAPDGNFIRSTRGLYSDYSKRVINILVRYTPYLEQASIDEAYLDMTDPELNEKGYIDIAKKIKNEIKASLNITCSVGISQSKTCSKIASKHNKPDGITFVPFGYEKEFLKDLPVQRIPGVGKSMLERLNKYDIFKIGDLLNHKIEFLEEIFGSYGLKLYKLANGEDYRTVNTEYDDRKSLSKENTFNFDINDINYLYKELYTLIEKACARLRKYGDKARTITVKVKYPDFSVNQKSLTKSFYSNIEMDFYEDAKLLLKKLLTKKKSIRLLGVRFNEFIKDDDSLQENLFTNESKYSVITKNIDKLRNKFNYDIIKFGKNFEKKKNTNTKL
jgi:DNA polymerase IV